MSVGRLDVDNCLDQLEWSQLEELRAYMHVRGISETRADVRFAYMFAMLCCKMGVEADPTDFVYLADEQESIDDLLDGEMTEAEMDALAINLGARRI